MSGEGERSVGGGEGRSELVRQLEAVGAVRRGRFVLKSGAVSNVYVDLRRVPSYPELFGSLCWQLAKLIPDRDVTLAGVPLGALPYVAVVAQILGLPSVMIRDKPKTGHGIAGAIDGDPRGRSIVLVEDVVTTGGSIDAAVSVLKANGLTLRRVVAVLDRNNLPGSNNLLKAPASDDWRARFSSVLTLDEILPSTSAGKLLPSTADDGKRTATGTATGDGKRAVVTKNAVTARLLRAMQRRRSNVVASLDIRDPDRLIEMAKAVASSVCALKLHLDLVQYVSDSERVRFAVEIEKLKAMYGLLIIEDRKFSDIGVIVRLQLAALPDFVDIVTAHAIAGPEALAELRRTIPATTRTDPYISAARSDLAEQPVSAFMPGELGEEGPREIGVLVVTQLSSAGNLIDPVYTARAAEMLDLLPNAVGAVSQQRLSRFLTATPGVNLDVSADGCGQTYRRPRQDLTDLYIVGRGITSAHDPAKAAARYRELCWPHVTSKL